MDTVHGQSEVLTHIYTEVQQRFAGLHDQAHGWEHIHRVYKLALHIAEQEHADSFIVGAAALLHDLGHTAPPDDQQESQHHADRSLALASELLQAYQLPAETQQAILHAILAHSFSRGVEPQTLEARVVRDADRLDALGAIGVMRWAITGTQRSTIQTKPYHFEDPFAEQHTPDDSLYLLDHFFTKLLKLGDTMATETGRFLAMRRVGFMNSYLYELKRELEFS